MVRIKPAQDLLILQSRLMSPGYAGPARWLIFKSSTRRTFAAIGPDVVPDVILALTRWSKEGLRAELASVSQGGGPVKKTSPWQTTQDDEDRYDRLLDLGLLETEEGNSPIPGALAPTSNVTTRFQLASYNYPFHDYADPTAIKDYHLLIQSFLSMGPPPASQITFAGETFQLPPINRSWPPKKGMTLEAVSFLLGHAFRPIGTLHTDSLDCIRRTSPSGGARHPTEPVIIIREALDGVPVGTYFYNAMEHALVRTPHNHYGLDSWAVDAPVSLVLWLKVERAMWRYRDLRALRPVLMDVGHIVETISFLAGNIELVGIATAPPPVTAPLAEWLDGPAVLSIHLQAGAAAAGARKASSFVQEMDRGVAQDFLTNPSFLMTFAGTELIGRVLWPAARSFGMDQADFRIMNHCLPSRRGDRLTTPLGIHDAIPEATLDQIERLVSTGALLPRRLAGDFLKGMGLWSRYGWYLSCLAHLEAVADWQSTPPLAQSIGKDVGYVGGLAALYERRTTRSFSKEAIALEHVLDLMGKVFECSPSIAPEQLQVYLAPTRVTGLGPGLYRWRQRDLEPLGIPLEPFQTPQGISSLVIGQCSAGAGALAVWIIAKVNTENGAVYQDTIIRLGRLGQRLCLTATEMGFGVFLTPAISDSMVAEMLRIDEPINTIGYFFSIGLPSDNPHEA